METARAWLTAVLTLVFCFGYVISDVSSGGHSDAMGPLTVFLVVIGSATAAFLIVHAPLLLSEAQKRSQVAAATRSYVEVLEQSREFAPIVVPGLHLEQGEFAIRHDRATLGEWRMARVGGGIGTSVRIGRVPIAAIWAASMASS